MSNKDQMSKRLLAGYNGKNKGDDQFPEMVIDEQWTSKVRAIPIQFH